MSYQRGVNEAASLKNDDGVKSSELVFSHNDSDELRGPEMPPTIYTSALLTPVGFHQKELYSFKSLLLISLNYGLVVYNYFFSLIVIFCIKALRDETPTCQADFWLLVLSVIAFSIYNVGEITETIGMFVWLHHQPTASEHLQLEFSDDSDEKIIVSGFTLSYKIFSYMFLLLPKLVIGLLISYYGNTFLLCSDSNQDIILNSMALKFVTENDEIVFETLVANNLKQLCSNLPALTISHNTKLLGLFRPFFVSITIAIIFGITYKDVCLDDPHRL